jgi:hypothetical protein
MAAAAPAQEPTAEPAPPSASESPEQWYYRRAPERTPEFTVAQLKAQARGAQRMARLEALRWYGFSNSRPVAAAIPWTTMYSPAWQMPGGRPFAWHAASRTVVINHAYPPTLYR